jgi:hypothetical protein
MNIETRYFKILREGISYELDSDIHYYHHLKVEELLVCDISYKVVLSDSPIIYKRIVNCNNCIDLKKLTRISDNIFTLNWDSIKSKRVNLLHLINQGYLVDITKYVNRGYKLELLGI